MRSVGCLAVDRLFLAKQLCFSKRLPCVVSAQSGTCTQGRSLPMGQSGQSEQLAPPDIKICKKKKKKCETLQYCDNNEFIELTVGTPRVLMSKAATNSICSNKHNVNIHM
jgi:hypothetical protein